MEEAIRNKGFFGKTQSSKRFDSSQHLPGGDRRAPTPRQCWLLSCTAHQGGRDFPPSLAEHGLGWGRAERLQLSPVSLPAAQVLPWHRRGAEPPRHMAHGAKRLWFIPAILCVQQHKRGSGGCERHPGEPGAAPLRRERSFVQPFVKQAEKKLQLANPQLNFAPRTPGETSINRMGKSWSQGHSPVPPQESPRGRSQG